MLSKIQTNFKRLGFIIKVFIRFGVIIHEICHIFFGIISGSKIKMVNLFEDNGGNVTFETKNYIGDLPKYSHKKGYLLFLIFNQIGIFLTSIGPLLFGIALTYILNYYLEIIDISDIENINVNYNSLIFLIPFSIIIPSFILSWQDIKNFIVSKQDTLGATIVGSTLNTLIFASFLFGLSFILNSFLLFSILFLLFFIFTSFIYLISFLITKILNKHNP